MSQDLSYRVGTADSSKSTLAVVGRHARSKWDGSVRRALLFNLARSQNSTFLRHRNDNSRCYAGQDGRDGASQIEAWRGGFQVGGCVRSQEGGGPGSLALGKDSIEYPDPRTSIIPLASPQTDSTMYNRSRTSLRNHYRSPFYIAAVPLPSPCATPPPSAPPQTRSQLRHQPSYSHYWRRFPPKRRVS